MKTKVFREQQEHFGNWEGAQETIHDQLNQVGELSNQVHNTRHIILLWT